MIYYYFVSFVKKPSLLKGLFVEELSIFAFGKFLWVSSHLDRTLLGLFWGIYFNFYHSKYLFSLKYVSYWQLIPVCRAKLSLQRSLDFILHSFSRVYCHQCACLPWGLFTSSIETLLWRTRWSIYNIFTSRNYFFLIDLIK